MTPKGKLENVYYFVKDGVVFDISAINQQNDKCGKHYVTYYVDPNSTVKAGQKYIDKNGNYVVADTDKTGVVSTGVINPDECEKVFPFFKVETEDEKTYYFWLDNFITDGDKMVDNKFVKTEHIENGESESGDEETIDFANYYVNYVKSLIARDIVNGKEFDKAKLSYPAYLFAKKGDTINVFGENVTVDKVEASYNIVELPIIKEDDLTESIYTLINGKVVTYSNDLLAQIGKRLKTDVTFIKEENLE